MSTLGEVVRDRGPFASVYLDASHDTEDAAKALELRWRGLREELARQGADENTLRAMDTAALDPAVGKAGRALIAAHGDLLLNRPLPRPPASDTARWSRRPHLLPLASLLGPEVPHVVVLADRAGADLHAHDGRVETNTEVHGETHPLHKVGGGGWSHKRLQNTVEETAQRNAARIAETAETLASSINARLLILGGELQARATIREELGPKCQEILVEIEGASLSNGTDDDSFDAAVQTLIAQHRYTQEHNVVERFTAESGREGGLAVQGMEKVVEALREANVAALLVADRTPLNDRLVFAGDDPSQVAVRESDLRALGVNQIEQHPADEVLAVAASATGAELVITEEANLWEGVGALLRHT
ncbi:MULTISPECIES: Rv2629 family ribosome hibernation factor [unclassified Saccharothrix]|uniref:Rv2629 family ribosome hibernation factor n=1 Tax=unclassified Saccharothrix TaxID=2593673 RepID=UPI00307DE83B